MEGLVFFLVPIIIIALFLYATFTSRQGRSPSRVPRREPLQTRTTPPAREAPAGSGARQARRQEREAEVNISRSMAAGEERLEQSRRPEYSAAQTPAPRPERSTAQLLPPVRAGRTQTPGRRSRPALLATPRAAREAFLVMELLRPPVAFRDTDDQDSAGP
jgi:hypothetical protein